MSLCKVIQKNIKKYNIKKIGNNDVCKYDICDAEEVLDELENIYLNRHRYKLEYAYEHAQITLNGFYKAILKDFDIERKKYEHSDTENHHISKFVKKLNRHIKKLHVDYHRNNTFIIIISLILSLGLILGIHWTTEHFVNRFNEVIDAFIIVFVFGVLKVFLEERFLREKVEEYGWEAYRKNIDKTKSNFAKVILSHIVIERANETGILLKDLIGEHNEFLQSLNIHSE